MKPGRQAQIASLKFITAGGGDMAFDGRRDMRDVSVSNPQAGTAGAFAGGLIGILGINERSSVDSPPTVPVQFRSSENDCVPFHTTGRTGFYVDVGREGDGLNQRERLELMVRRSDRDMEPNIYDSRLQYADVLIRALKENKQVQLSSDGKLSLTSTPATPADRIELHKTAVNVLYKYMDQIRLRGCLSEELNSRGDTDEADRMNAQVTRMRERMQQGRIVDGKLIVPNQLIEGELNLLTRDLPRTTDSYARETMEAAIRDFQKYLNR